MSTSNERVRCALEALKQGKMIILTDDPARENEGDLVMAAEKITPNTMNFMIRQGTGIVCLSMTEKDLSKLNLPLMIPSSNNTSARGTPFTISIDARENISTGVSANDRAHTVLTAIHPDTTPQDLVRPGHIFPLMAQEGGVLKREGHTEGALDLVKMAGLQPAAVLCEIMNQDGSMASGTQLNDFAAAHELIILSIKDILTYRYRFENLIEDQASTILPLEHYGFFDLTIIKEKITGHEHIVLKSKKQIQSDHAPLVRIHSACITGDLFSSRRCDCNQALHYALKAISEEGGVLIYLNQEGRGIGLLNKIKAYALQDTGLDTVEANEKLGLPIDSRQYHLAAAILRNMDFNNIRLLTNNPHKIAAMHEFGIEVKAYAVPIVSNEFNLHYLKTKKEKLKHTIHHC